MLLMVGHAFRRLGAARRAKELVGELGTVVLAEARFSLPGQAAADRLASAARTQPRWPAQLGIHHADTLAYLLGPVARTTGRFAHVHTDAEIDDVGVATLEFLVGRARRADRLVRVAARVLAAAAGQRRCFDALPTSGGPAAERVDEVSTLALNGEPVEFEPRDMLAEELAEFGVAMRGEAVIETGAAEGIAALRVILDAVGTRVLA